MSRPNVRCAAREKCADGIGWTGERRAIGYVTRHEADTLPIDELRARVLANTAKLRTAKPCPKCGGQVVLIDERRVRDAGRRQMRLRGAA